MTIREFRASLEKAEARPCKPGQPGLVEAMEDITEIWSNNSCKGYFIAAAQDAGLDLQTIRRVLECMSAVHEEMSVDEAEKKYREF